MANYKVTDTELTSIANAIRMKGGTQAQLVFPTGFVSAVGDILSVTSEDNGKVVVNGALVSQTERTVMAVGAYDTTTNNSVVVDIDDYDLEAF